MNTDKCILTHDQVMDTHSPNFMLKQPLQKSKKINFLSNFINLSKIFMPY